MPDFKRYDVMYI